jgi:hypothetical protein
MGDATTFVNLHRTETLRTIARTSVPPRKRPSALGENVVHLTEERLVSRVASAQAKEPKRTGREGDLSPDEPVRPVPINENGVPEQRHGAPPGRPAEGPAAAARWPPRFELPLPGEGPPGRRVRRAGASA